MDRLRMTCNTNSKPRTWRMGLVVLHSGHHQRSSNAMMGTTCNLRWREVGEKGTHLDNRSVAYLSHRVFLITFVIDNTEMYGERFDIPDDGKVVLYVVV